VAALAKAKAPRKKNKKETPPKPPSRIRYEMQTAVLSVRLPRETADLLRAVLETRGQSLAEWITTSLRSDKKHPQTLDTREVFQAGLRRGREQALAFTLWLFTSGHGPGDGTAAAEEVLETVRIAQEEEVPAALIVKDLLESLWESWTKQNVEGK
jgi:hypothetical protein